MDRAEPADEQGKLYTVTTASTNQQISFRVPRDQQPPHKIRLCNGSNSISVFYFHNDIDSYVELTKDELERFDRGFKTGQCRHSAPLNRDTGDERFHKRLAKLQKKLKEKKNNDNYCSYCEEYGDVLNIEIQPVTSENTMSIGKDSKIETQDLKFSKPEAASLDSSSIQITWDEGVKNNEHLKDCAFELQISRSKNSTFQTIYRGSEKVFTVTDLLPGTRYSFRVRAIKDSVEGPFSPDVTVLTDAAAPTAPDQPYISSKTKTHVILKWTTKSDNGSPIKSYVLQCNNIGRDGFYTIYEGPQKQYRFNPKLASMETCLFRVKAINGIGESEFSPDLLYTASAGVPSSPDRPVLVKAAANSLRLSWTKPNSNGAEISEYTLQMEDENKGYGFRPVYRGNELRCVVDDDLERNTTYKFRLSATNAQGESKWSDVVSFATACQAPARMSAPIVEGKVHTKSFAVGWTPPVDDGGSDIIAYTLQVDDGKGGPFFVAYTGQEMSHKFHDLFPAYNYKVRVCCTSGSFQSQWSDITKVRTSPVVSGPPSAPREIIRENKTPYNIELVWDTPAYNGGAKVSNYNVQMKKLDTEEFRHVYLGQSICCLVSGLIPNTEYCFRVRAQNIAGDSKFSEVSIINTGPGPPDPIPPPQVSCRSSNIVQVSWEVPKDNGAAVTGYVLQWANKPTGPFVQVYSGVKNNYEIKKNLLPFTIYYFRVQAASNAGLSNWSDVVFCKTPAAPPNQVTNLKVVGRSSTSIMLQWPIPEDNGAIITSYNIDIVGYEIKSYVLDGNENDDEDVDKTDPSNLDYELTGLQPSTQYRFRVQAVNKSGCGSFSSIISATTGNVPPEAPVLDMVNSSYQSVKLSWKYVHMRNETTELNYELQIRTHDAISFKTIFKGSSTSFKVGKLREQTKYSFRVRAANEAGYGPYSVVHICETGIEPPSSVKIKAHEGTMTKLTLTWNTVLPVQPSDQISYILEWQRKGLTDLEELYQGNKTTFTCTKLTPEQNYSFRVCAVRTLADGRKIQNAFCPIVSYTVPTETKDSDSELTTKNEETEYETPVKHFTERNLAMFVFIGFAAIILGMSLLLSFFVN